MFAVKTRKNKTMKTKLTIIMTALLLLGGCSGECPSGLTSNQCHDLLMERAKQSSHADFQDGYTRGYMEGTKHTRQQNIDKQGER